MKKFIVFLVSIIVVCCIGLVTFYFLRNDEVIRVATKEIYCNAGDEISYDALGIEIKDKNKKTTYDFNAGGENVTKNISFNSLKNCYQVSSSSASEVTLVITTSNTKYSRFEIKVHVGNGVDNPYYIFNEKDLSKIGSVYSLSGKFQLMNDITLSKEFLPIGFSSQTGFIGDFDGNKHAISSLYLHTNSENAGLFTTIGSAGSVHDLTIDYADIGGEFSFAGVLAGKIDGSIKNITIANSTLVNKKVNGITGLVCGTLTGKIASVEGKESKLTVGVENQQSTNIKVGGLVGFADTATIRAVNTNDVTLEVINLEGAVGGLVGEFTIGSQNGEMVQSYANTSCEFNKFGALIGTISKTSTFDESFDKMLMHFVGNISVGSKAVYSIFENGEDYFYNFYNREKGLYMIRTFADADSIVQTNEYVLYSIKGGIYYWDSSVWEITKTDLPKLKMAGADEAVILVNDYLNQDLSKNGEAQDPEDPIDPEEPIEPTQGGETAQKFIETFYNKENVENVNFVLGEDVDLIELNWIPVSLTNCTIDGNGYKIIVKLNNNKNNNAGLFNIINGSTIKNLTLEVKDVNVDATNFGAVASIANNNSAVEHVNVIYSSAVKTNLITNFGGIVGDIDQTTINYCGVEGLIVNGNVNNAGAISSKASSSVRITNTKIDAIITASELVGGAVAESVCVIDNVYGKVNLTISANIENAKLGGIVAVNKGTIQNSNVEVIAVVGGVNKTLYAGGIAGINSGNIENSRVIGGGISVASYDSGRIYIGGLVALNSGKILAGQNLMDTIGSYLEGKDIRVGGIVAINEGEIKECVTSSNLNGNYVAGVVVEMTKTSISSIDSIFVGNYNKETNELTDVTLKADKYLANIAVDFRLGTISNIQVVSSLIGGTNATRSSLIVLIFPDGAKLTNVTIDSSITGSGYKYRDSWVDFASYTKKSDFGFENKKITEDTRFNIYEPLSNCGEMTSVVINTARTGVSETTRSYAVLNTLWFISTGSSYNGTNFVKEVNGFNNVSQFVGKFDFKSAKGLNDKYETTSKTLTFDVSGTWTSNNGIILTFVTK